MSTPTAEQIETLFNFLEEHRVLARGILRSVEGRLRSHQLWESVCTTLNAMGGCTKTTKQWQKVWTDKKYLAKKAAAAARRSASATGGGPSSTPQLSQWELRVISIMGDVFGEPQTTARVSAFVDPVQDPPSLEPYSVTEEVETEEICFISISRNIPYLENPAKERASTDQENLAGTSGVAPSTQRTIVPPLTATQTPRMREQRLPRRGSFRENLLRLDEARLHLDEQRNGHLSHLADIRVALVELCGLAREMLEQQRRNNN